MHSALYNLMVLISSFAIRPFSEGGLYKRRSFLPSELAKEDAPCSYSYRINKGSREVYVWYQVHEFDPKDASLSNKKRYRCEYVKKIFSQTGELISEKKGVFYS